jgi:hypothetical protein
MCYSPNRNLLVDALVRFASPEAFWLPTDLSFRACVFLPVVPCHIATIPVASGSSHTKSFCPPNPSFCCHIPPASAIALEGHQIAQGKRNGASMDKILFTCEGGLIFGLIESVRINGKMGNVCPAPDRYKLGACRHRRQGQKPGRGDRPALS